MLIRFEGDETFDTESEKKERESEKSVPGVGEGGEEPKERKRETRSTHFETNTATPFLKHLITNASSLTSTTFPSLMPLCFKARPT